MSKQDYNIILQILRNNLKNYIIESKLKSLVLGISGGIDSALVAAIAKPVCDDLNIPLIGAWIEIETNTQEEKSRAVKVGEELCSLFFIENLKLQYVFEQEKMDEPINNDLSCLCLYKNEFIEKCGDSFHETEHEKKIRLGNIKARMRMMYLYNLAQRYKGATLDTDNRTEYELGFWTIHGDDFDISILSHLWKTEVYELAKYIHETEMTNNIFLFYNNVLLDCINAVPTDGLGITSSDVEQFGCNSYDEVDDILIKLCNIKESITHCGEVHLLTEMNKKLQEKYGSDIVNNVWNRHIRSEFKRKLPIELCKQ